MSDDTRLTFKEMCARFDVTPRTLRYYEYIELLSPEREGRSRFYGPRERARMELILRGRSFEFALEDIRCLASVEALTAFSGNALEGRRQIRLAPGFIHLI